MGLMLIFTRDIKQDYVVFLSIVNVLSAAHLSHAVQTIRFEFRWMEGEHAEVLIGDRGSSTSYQRALPKALAHKHS